MGWYVRANMQLPSGIYKFIYMGKKADGTGAMTEDKARALAERITNARMGNFKDAAAVPA
ncbi:hypothetical protein KY342_03375 [Candidatus Woesearchaeota archaeon]|nr:hypothetical protein [Candidatus Woesearchaeota archaeon]